MIPEAIFFDAAGTLFEIREPVGETYSRFARIHGLNADPRRLDKAFRQAWSMLPPPLHEEGRPPKDDDRAWWRTLVAHTFAEAQAKPLEPAENSALFDDLYGHFAKAEAWKLFSDAPAALSALQAKHRLSVLSNFDKRLVGILEGLKIRHFFTDVIVSSEIGASKPHPRMFRAALNAAGLPAENCLHVGDDPHSDQAGASLAGLRCFLIDRPRTTLADLARKLSRGEI